MLRYSGGSYKAYLETLDAVKALAGDAAITQENLDAAVAQLTAARLALVARPVWKGLCRCYDRISRLQREIGLSAFL